ncbi:MAG TPA: ArsR family transcriptional regulator, partial [Pseudolabrys sp.]|nr:ArsR family transcriptional regulator [Pseudolabrys sp.]
MPVQTSRRPKAAADIGIAELERKAGEAAALLKLLANENRLLILCRLVVAGEMSVGDLAEAVDLSQSALSQH